MMIMTNLNLDIMLFLPVIPHLSQQKMI